MTKTLRASRPHITIFGETNSGKSALFNAILGVKQAIVSPVAGTTTDPVGRAFELLPYGAVYLTDTAGLNDTSDLGRQRMAKTRRALDGADLAVYTVDIAACDLDEYRRMVGEFNKRDTPHVVVFTKADVHTAEKIQRFIAEHSFENTYIVFAEDEKSLEALRAGLATELEKIKPEEEALLGTALEGGSTIIAAVTVDSETPKGRLILPQVQLIRECVDRNIKCVVVSPSGLKAAYEAEKIDLVVVDSQSFAYAAAVLPDNALLTSFSILMSRAKGNIKQFAAGLEALPRLRDGDRVLVAEACAHNTSHEDIGRVKIPAVLKKLTGKRLELEFVNGRDFPDNIANYGLVVHCGGCMLTRKEMLNRLRAAGEAAVPVTNYGVLLAHGNGILGRCLECCTSGL
jgi:[FeFe] hydrogenase H-cluster maturation GTPase HydF